MVVKMTKVLKEFLEADGLDSQLFINLFKKWKSSGEYSSFHFGKDAAYFTPIVNGGKYILRHVHLVPLVDKSQKERWLRAWKVRGRKTSDRVLVYVSDKKGNFLLIFILSEPNAHEVARMGTKQNKEIMEGFAAIAEEFINHGSVSA
jgi:mRNA interferase YafO